MEKFVMLTSFVIIIVLVSDIVDAGIIVLQTN